ncbi:MAG: DUF3598 family protein [Prochlorococcaceae cyanobacterium]
MASQWDNFLKNLGEWHGSFDALDASGAVLSSTPSVLKLEAADNNTLVHFSLSRFGPEGRSGAPISDTQQDYRTLGRQVVFFDSGSFCKGSLQVAPGTPFGAEFGFIHGDRRHRLVQLHDSDGQAERLVLIREHRAGTPEADCPALTPDQLKGNWRGIAATITADWPEPDCNEAALCVDAAGPGPWAFELSHGTAPPQSFSAQSGTLSLQWLPDGGYHLAPSCITHRQAFMVQAGWLRDSGHLDVLIRRYDATGAWNSASWLALRRDQAS